MVAIINTGHSIRSIFTYNENKVKQGVAECIGEGNYPVDIENMSTVIKLNRLLRQAALNENVSRNSVHISLNFDLSESFLDTAKLMEIAKVYMEGIGFGQQPYLVYRHHDSGHPHIHIVSIKIRSDGKRIDMQNIGKNQSENTRKEIEKAFGLVVAGEKKNSQFELRPVNIAKALYGQAETKRAIATVLALVLETYKYSGMGELNAVLNLYNISADPGGEKSRIFLNGGLVYRILDESGKPTGVPIKASSFYNKPTLKFLQSKFAQGKPARLPHAGRIKNAIDLILRGAKIPVGQFQRSLAKEGIDMVLRKNADRLLYGITYVDHITKCVFNGSALGKQYSAKLIQERCSTGFISEEKMTIGGAKKTIEKNTRATDGNTAENGFHGNYSNPTEKLLGQLASVLTTPEQDSSYLPKDLKGKKKKKKRKGQSDTK